MVSGKYRFSVKRKNKYTPLLERLSGLFEWLFEAHERGDKEYTDNAFKRVKQRLKEEVENEYNISNNF